MNCLKKLYRYLTNWRWEIGFVDNTLEGIIAGEPLRVNWVNLPFRDRWFADPFILDYNDDDIIVLAEEYADDFLRGRIAKLIIGRKTYKLKSWKIILDLHTHLSFPRIDRTANGIYIHPENNNSGCHTIYKYDSDKDELKEGHIICDQRLTDAVMLNYKGRDLLFSTYTPTANGSVLHVFERSENNELYKEIDTIEFPSRVARMAGDFFEVNGKLYRPAQDCNGEYGYAVILQEVNHINDKWQFRDIRRITSPHPVLKRGCHTFNHYKDMLVIDVKGYRFPFVGKILEMLRQPTGKKMKDFTK